MNRIELGQRTIKMLAHFLNLRVSEIKMKSRLRKDLGFNDADLEILEQWIEGPISRTVPGFFQDVGTDVRTSSLTDFKASATVMDLAELIWNDTPVANQKA